MELEKMILKKKKNVKLIIFHKLIYKDFLEIKTIMK